MQHTLRHVEQLLSEYSEGAEVRTSCPPPRCRGECFGSTFRPKPGWLECLRKLQDNIMLNNTPSQLNTCRAELSERTWLRFAGLHLPDGRGSGWSEGGHSAAVWPTSWCGGDKQGRSRATGSQPQQHSSCGESVPALSLRRPGNAVGGRPPVLSMSRMLINNPVY